MNNKYTTNVSFAIMALFSVVLTMTGPLLSEIAQTYSLGMSQTGMIFTSYFIGFIVFVITAGILSDRLGKKKVIFFSITGISLSLVLFPLSPNFTAAIVVMFFIGGFGGTLETLVSALISEINPKNPGYYVNLSQVFFGLGALAGPTAAGIGISKGVPWQVFYYILGGLFLLVSLFFAKVRISTVSKEKSFTVEDFKSLIVDGKFLLICLCMLFYTGSEVGSWGWMSTFLKESLNFSDIQSSVSVGVFWGSMTVGRLLAGALALRFGTRNIILLLGYASAMVTAVSGFVYDEAAIYLVIAAMGFAYSSLWPLLVSFGGIYRKSSSGTVFSLLIGSGSIGSAIVPYVMGVIGENIGTQIATISPAILLLMIGLVFTGFKENMVSEVPVEA